MGTILVKSKILFSNRKRKINSAIPIFARPLVQEVKEAVVESSLHKHPETANNIIERIVFNEKLRRELAAVKKEAKEKQKKISFKIPKLRDCKYHYQDESAYSDKTMIFLTEGDSASASIVASRDPLTQAVFSLRGKPLNVLA